TNLGLCCRLLQWALIETSDALEVLKEKDLARLPLSAYLTTCNQQYERLRACLSTAMAIGELIRQSGFDNERALFAGLIPELIEQLALISSVKLGARASKAWTRE